MSHDTKMLRVLTPVVALFCLVASAKAIYVGDHGQLLFFAFYGIPSAYMAVRVWRPAR